MTIGAADVPERYLNRLALSFSIDTHILDDDTPAMEALHALHLTGWIELYRTDTIDTELANAPEDRRAHLLDASSGYTEHLGGLQLGHSRLGSCVLRSEQDVERYEAVFATIFPNVDRHGCRDQHIRDARHIETAIKYGDTGFLTREKRLLKRQSAIREAFGWFTIGPPEWALEIAERRKARYERRTGSR